MVKSNKIIYACLFIMCGQLFAGGKPGKQSQMDRLEKSKKRDINIYCCTSMVTVENAYEEREQRRCSRCSNACDQRGPENNRNPNDDPIVLHDLDDEKIEDEGN